MLGQQNNTERKLNMNVTVILGFIGIIVPIVMIVYTIIARGKTLFD